VSIHLLLEAALRSLLMGAMIFIALRLMRIDQVRARRTAWLLALAGALAMPLVIGAQIGPRLLPEITLAGTLRAQPPAVRFNGASATLPAPAPLPATVLDGDGGRSTPLAGNLVSLVAIGYCVVAALFSVRLCAGVGFALRLRYQAERVELPFDRQLDVRTSSRISTPVTIASSVLLPSSYSTWDESTLRIVLSHERAHVRQADFCVHVLASLHCALFWFNPFSWWLQRQLSELGEALSDRAAVEQAESRASYAEILLAFAIRAHQPFAGVAMASSSNLTQRIERLLSDHSFERCFAGKQRLALVAAGVVMLAMITSTSTARVAAATDTTNNTLGDAGAHNDAGAETHDEGIVAIRAGKSRITINSGNMLPAANGDYIYFRHQGKTYLIQDPGIIAQTQALLIPMEELGLKQKELGKQQALLGAQQRLLNAQQRAVKVETPDFKREIAELETVMKRMNLAQVAAQIDQKELANLQAHLGEIQAHVSELQAELGQQQGNLGEQQGAIGEQQGKLGEQRELLAEQRRKIIEDLRRQLQPLIEQAIREGKGKPLGNW
jgi:beta-lactamase regulating signal transducer with metallopeptidase domain